MEDSATGSGLLRRAWSRLLDGDRAWGSLEIRPDRFGVTRYHLIVFPPGISHAERRRVRIARGWPLWGVLVWLVCEICLSRLLGQWTAVFASSVVYLGVGLLATIRAGDQRRQVRTISAMVMAGHRDPVSNAVVHKVDTLAGAMLEADELLARGDITPAAHELMWWQVYEQMAPARVAA
jgi:hypothetical protein